ncbi:hypothetical protein [Clostridium weizhouense]|uniref:DNA-binding protein n=1 Tax=Clostridium weizhouense TaxID=2859781 RepID=A0ABS7AUZ7_9CLOT|nr:hypothetical protein [Clostridium weizhouense]MBW6411600.1 hypothetical protein [Clostridium weizhouense]
MKNKEITKELFAAKDNDGNLTNEVVCDICNKGFRWTDGVNSLAVVKSISVIGYYNKEEKQFNLNVTAKCPHCNFRSEYNQYYKEKK